MQHSRKSCIWEITSSRFAFTQRVGRNKKQSPVFAKEARFFRAGKTLTFPHGYGGMILAMRRKDPELYEKISSMSVWSGMKAWREKYPEDMEGVVQSTPYDGVGPHLIKGI